MPQSVAQNIYEKIRRMVVAGELEPGQRLVNRTLAQNLGVSTIPVREAIQRLVSEGLVDHIPGGGAYVRQLHRREIAKLYEFRVQLEIFAVREAAQHADTYHLDRLDTIGEESRAFLDGLSDTPDDAVTPEQITAWFEFDGAFHNTLIEAADNPWLSKTANELQLLSHAIRTKPRQFNMDAANHTCEEHQALAGLIRRGEPEAAADLITKHIDSSVKSMLRHFFDEARGTA